MWRRCGVVMVSALDSESRERFGFEPWPGSLCCVLRQGTVLSLCPYPRGYITGYLLGVTL